MALGLESLPRDIESERVDSPFLEIDEIFLDEWVVRVEAIAGRIEWKLLIDDIQPMHDSNSVMLVSEEIASAIDWQESGDGQQYGK